MDRSSVGRIEVEAARALSSWTSQFAEGVRNQARQLAAQSDRPGLITASQYRQAAISALQSLSVIIADEANRDDSRTAA
jgi:hypothetical protein